MHIVRGAPFREEIKLTDSTGRPVFNNDAKLYIYLEYGEAVQKAQLPFDGTRAVFELTPASTIAIPYDRLFYKVAVEANKKESILSTGIITIGA